MKKTLSVLFLSLLLFSCHSANENQQENGNKDIPPTATKATGKNRVEVLDFYGTHRCTTCINIEANSRYTLDSAFKKEVKAGTVVFKTINFDDSNNEKIVTEYGAYGTSLFLNVVKDGNEKHIDLTEFAFKWGNEKEKYAKLLEEKIRKELKNL